MEIEVTEVAGEEEAAAIAIIKTPVVISAKTWIISNLNTPDMGIENVIRIIETQEDIKEVAVVVVEEAEIIEEIPVRIMVKITIKVMTINNRSILAKEILMEMTIEAVETIIKTGEKVEEGREVEEEAEFKVDGIKVAIILA